MNKLFLIGVGVVLLRVPGIAAPCIPGSLASYIALGSTGCVLGNLTVSGFAYAAKAGGGAEKIKADQIAVTPVLTPGAVALEFAANWSVQSGQEEVSNITYHALSADPAVEVKAISLDGNGFEAGLMGEVEVQEVVAGAAEAATLDIYLKCTEVCHPKTSASAAITPSAALVAGDRVTLKSKQGTAALSSFSAWFITCPPCL